MTSITEEFEREQEEEIAREQWNQDLCCLVTGYSFCPGCPPPGWAKLRPVHYDSYGRMQWGWPPDERTASEIIASAQEDLDALNARAWSNYNDQVDYIKTWKKFIGKKMGEERKVFTQDKYDSWLEEANETRSTTLTFNQETFDREKQRAKELDKPKPRPPFFDDFTYPNGDPIPNDPRTLKILGAYQEAHGANPPDGATLRDWYTTKE